MVPPIKKSLILNVESWALYCERIGEAITVFENLNLARTDSEPGYQRHDDTEVLWR
jgi:hypothetical protein